jgi:beta-xylosidase
MKFRNPIIPGFAPDPSIILVGDTYILVNSSFHVFPGLPIYSSQNLQDWELKGHALSRPSQLSLSEAFTKFIPLPHGVPLVITGGLFAPTIRYFRNTFYIVCTYAYEKGDGSHHFQNFLLSCPEADIFSVDGWSDAKYFEFPGIDPGLFFDEETGKAYLHGSYRTGPPWAPDCSIQQFEIDVRTGQALSDTKFLWKGAAGKDDAEGPHLYLKDGWYYLMTAENTTFEGHQINIARSKHIWGPYEGCPSNPLLTALGGDEDVRWCGHGDLVQSKRGDWFCVHLGIQHDRTNIQRHPLGRETFLTPVKWPEGDWPTIAQTKLEFETDVGGGGGETSEVRIERYMARDDHLEDIYIRTPDLQHYSYSASENAYTLVPQYSTLSSPLGTSTFVGRRQRFLSGSASATLKLDLTQGGSPLSAGLAVYKDSLRHVSIYVDNESRTVVCEVVAIADQRPTTTKPGSVELPPAVDKITFRIQAERDRYVFLWCHSTADDDLEWQTLAEVDTVLLSGYDMTGTIYGIFAKINGAEDTTEQYGVTFTGFEVE